MYIHYVCCMCIGIQNIYMYSVDYTLLQYMQMHASCTFVYECILCMYTFSCNKHEMSNDYNPGSWHLAHNDIQAL